MLVRTYLDVLLFYGNCICGVEKCCAIPWKLFFVDNFTLSHQLDGLLGRKEMVRWCSTTGN